VDEPGRAQRLLRAPLDWLGILRWGARSEGPEAPLLVQGVVEGDAGVLLTLRRELCGWELPGGRAEPGETEAEALVREIREETGLRVEPLALVGEYRRSGFASHRARVYRCRPLDGALRPSAETPRVAWFRPDALAGSSALLREEHLGLSAISHGLAIDLRERWRGSAA
jgi:8-oxo-dGTP pyrophosphatase MutT (NUDIX family)